MIAFPKPRGFWDYTLFALVLTGLLMFLFWLESSAGVGWTDALLACAVAGCFVFAIIIARRGEKARWIAQPTWRAHALAALGAFILMLGAMYADVYLLHRRNLNRLPHDVVPWIAAAAGTLWSIRRRFRAGRQPPNPLRT